MTERHVSTHVCLYLMQWYTLTWCHSWPKAGCYLRPIIYPPLPHKQLHLYHGSKPRQHPHQDCMSDICPAAHTCAYKRTKIYVGHMTAFSHAVEKCFNTLRKEGGRAWAAKKKTQTQNHNPATLRTSGRLPQKRDRLQATIIVAASQSPARNYYLHFSYRKWRHIVKSS